MFKLKTNRLQIIPLTHEQINLLQQNRRLMEENLGLVPSAMLISTDIQSEIAEVVPYWLDFTAQNPDNYAWGTTWEIVLKKENKSIGSLGMSGFPDKNGEVMVGYVIDVNYQKNGYATEALATLKNWAFEHVSVLRMAALTPKDNIASQKVLKKNHFQQVGEDIEDGTPCYVWHALNH